jgi:large subunit ribosomal protein L10
LTEKISRAKSIVFTSFQGLTAKESEELRKQLKSEKSEFLVVKKTLLDLALKENRIGEAKARDFDGRIAAVFGYDDEVMPAKVIGKFRNEHENKIDFLAGWLDHKMLDYADVNVLANLPSRLELKAKIVGSLNAPLSGLVNVLAGNLRSLIYVLKAIETIKT